MVAPWRQTGYSLQEREVIGIFNELLGAVSASIFVPASAALIAEFLTFVEG
ncbi:MAG: hypothetical protein ABWY13_06175 [Mesorhizobium sp.]